jgi:hypothetical protein
VSQVGICWQISGDGIFSLAVSMQHQHGKSITGWTGLLETLRYRGRLPIVMFLLSFALLGDLSAIAADLTHHCSDNRLKHAELLSEISGQEVATIPFERRESCEPANSSIFVKKLLKLSDFFVPALDAYLSLKLIPPTATTSHDNLHCLLRYTPRPPPLA